ncbi:MAG TPA: hypothetical protein DDY98_03365 [Ruminococcaceae bacterium]|nr:hypothetical protein [Oscillospiraceae bacterium]
MKTQFGIEPLLKAEDGILLSSRRKGDKTYLFAVNMKDRPVKLFLDRPMTELLTNRVMNGEVEVSGYDTLVLE